VALDQVPHLADQWGDELSGVLRSRISRMTSLPTGRPIGAGGFWKRLAGDQVLWVVSGGSRETVRRKEKGSFWSDAMQVIHQPEGRVQ
jgi:hypothetical protein